MQLQHLSCSIRDHARLKDTSYRKESRTNNEISQLVEVHLAFSKSIDNIESCGLHCLELQFKGRNLPSKHSTSTWLSLSVVFSSYLLLQLVVEIFSCCWLIDFIACATIAKSSLVVRVPSTTFKQIMHVLIFFRLYLLTAELAWIVLWLFY